VATANRRSEERLKLKNLPRLIVWALVGALVVVCLFIAVGNHSASAASTRGLALPPDAGRAAAQNIIWIIWSVVLSVWGMALLWRWWHRIRPIRSSHLVLRDRPDGADAQQIRAITALLDKRQAMLGRHKLGTAEERL
jgi:hypothetical protein